MSNQSYHSIYWKAAAFQTGIYLYLIKNKGQLSLDQRQRIVDLLTLSKWECVALESWSDYE